MVFANGKRYIRTGSILTLAMICVLQTNLVRAQELGVFTDNKDIGSVQGANEADFDEGVKEYYILSDGDIWNAQDAFHFLYKEISGSFSISGNLLLFGGGKIGLMARKTLDANSPHYLTIVNGSGQTQSQYRLETGGATVSFTAYDTFDGKVELVRLGDSFYGYYIDPNTEEKLLMHSIQIDMPDTIYVGIAASSGSIGTQTEGIAWDLNIQLYDFYAARELPAFSFIPGQIVNGIKVSVDVREGSTPDMTIVETPPEGWTISNIQATQGEATLGANGNITWNVAQATGNPSMTYDATPPEIAPNGIWKGTIGDGANTFEVFGDLGMSNEYLVKVYFVTSGDFDAPSNAIYRDLLGPGLTMLDENGDEIFIPGLKYSVSMIDQNNDKPLDALNFDVVIAHENCASGSVGDAGSDGRYVDKPVPYLMMEQALFGGADNKPGYIWFGTGGTESYAYDEIYVLEDHPITDLWGKDQYIPITRNENPTCSYIPYANIAPGVTPLGEWINAGGYILVVADEGTTGLLGSVDPPEGADPTPARRAILGYHETVHVFDTANDDSIDDIALTKDGAILFQRLVQWLVSKEVTADGTEGGVGIGDWSIY